METQSKRAMVEAFQSVWAVKDIGQLYRVLMGVKDDMPTVESGAFDPATASDEERADMYKHIITNVMGEEFYNSVMK